MLESSKFSIKIVFIVFIIVNIVACNDTENSTVNMFQYPLDCPSNAIEEVNNTSAVGEVRKARLCVIRHGMYTEWKDDILVMKGAYENGKKSGTWIWYDKSGKETNRKTYDL